MLWDHVSSPNFGFAHSPGDSLAAILHAPHSRAPDPVETFPFMKAVGRASRRHDREVPEGGAGSVPLELAVRRGAGALDDAVPRVPGGGRRLDGLRPSSEFASRYVSYLILKAVELPQLHDAGPGRVRRRTHRSRRHAPASSRAIRAARSARCSAGRSRSRASISRTERRCRSPSPARRPDVDVFIDDGRGGEYMPYLPTSAATPRSGTGPPADGRGRQSASRRRRPELRLRPRAQPRHRPGDRRDRARLPVAHAAASVWPTDWKAADTRPRCRLPDALPPAEAAVVGPFPWTPQAQRREPAVRGERPGDRSNVETVTAGPILERTARAARQQPAQRKF